MHNTFVLRKNCCYEFLAMPTQNCPPPLPHEPLTNPHFRSAPPPRAGRGSRAYSFQAHPAHEPSKILTSAKTYSFQANQDF